MAIRLLRVKLQRVKEQGGKTWSWLLWINSQLRMEQAAPCGK